MKTTRLFPLEFGRLLQNRLTWLIVLLTVISPAAGLFLYKPATATTMLSFILPILPSLAVLLAASCLACSQYLNWIVSAAAGRMF